MTLIKLKIMCPKLHSFTSNEILFVGNEFNSKDYNIYVCCGVATLKYSDIVIIYCLFKVHLQTVRHHNQNFVSL